MTNGKTWIDFYEGKKNSKTWFCSWKEIVSSAEAFIWGKGFGEKTEESVMPDVPEFKPKPTLFVEEKDVDGLDDPEVGARLKINLEVTVTRKTQDESGRHVMFEIDRATSEGSLDPVMRNDAMGAAFDKAVASRRPPGLIPSAS